MAMKLGLRKFALSVHLILSIGWIGAVIAFLALGVCAAISNDAQAVRAAWIAMEVIGWAVIVPLAVGALLTGVVMSLATPWGLFHYYWVLITLALTILSTVVLLLHMQTVSSMAEMARQMEAGNHGGLGDLLHPALGLVILLAVTLLNVYKPQGLTRYGWRKQQEERVPSR